MMNRIQQGGLQVAQDLYQLINEQIIPGTGVESVNFWREFEAVLDEFTAKNQALLDKRDQFQSQIDKWHKDRQDKEWSFEEYKAYLLKIGYLVPEGDDFVIGTENVDSEISSQAGPQLVVPVKNARFALNAANARWGSLYDALYGTDVIPQTDGAESTGGYNPVRGQKVIEYGRQYLDQAIPLSQGSHSDVVAYIVENDQLLVKLRDGGQSGLSKAGCFMGYRGEKASPTAILLRHNGLHLEIQIDASNIIGQADSAGVKDILVEAAITTIMDCEDSIAAVDSEDKVEVYSNWLGLMKGTLSDTFMKAGKEVSRSLKKDRVYNTPNDGEIVLHGRSLLFIRNVGHLMTNNAILNSQGAPIPEGIMDAMVTVLAAMHDLNNSGELSNSRTGSVYIVKPKMHGPEEVAFTNELFARVEDALNLPRFTIKMGIMDEERRTSVNLKSCIREAKNRVVFINTGFLDRTGDEIHTSMHAGAMIPKGEMKGSTWIAAYEDSNVDIGLAAGLSGKAQIGKGMWAMPDEMAAMMAQKIAHPKSGANTAWVPSPNGATLHSMHYHQINIWDLQSQLKTRVRASVDDILQIPVMPKSRQLSKDDIQKELDNNAQGILGYVVRWVEQGIGCSKVPDIKNVGLMEDRATLRISSQHMANWLLHGICSKEQVNETMRRMAKIVDEQNAGDPGYRAMSANYDQSVAFSAACDLVFKGVDQPSGYTEPLLHEYRAKAKIQ